MTEERTKAVRSFIWQRVGIWAIGGGLWIFSMIAVAIFTPVGTKIMDIWHTPNQLEVIEQKLDQILETQAELTGRNRVTDQPEDMSYVREPVHFGDRIDLILFIGRTDIGAACILKEIIPIFADENGVTLSGDPRRPRQQLGAEVVRRMLSLDQPSGLVPGRTRLQLQLEYECGNRTVFELTKPVFYYAIPTE